MSMHIDGLDRVIADFAAVANMTTEDKLEILRPGAKVIMKHMMTYLRAHHWRTGALAASIDMEELAISDPVIRVMPGKENKTVARQKHAGSRTWRRRTYRIHDGSGRTKPSHHGPGNTVMDVAWYLNYGTSRIPATHWFDHAMEEAADEFYAVTEDGYNAFLASHGFGPAP